MTNNYNQATVWPELPASHFIDAEIQSLAVACGLRCEQHDGLLYFFSEEFFSEEGEDLEGEHIDCTEVLQAKLRQLDPSSYDGFDYHSASWLYVSELLEFDYDTPMEDRRVARQMPSGILNGGCTCEPGEGEKMTFREFLGPAFFDDLEKLKAEGADRVVFWFDN
jgi:hypothetical protein